MSNRIESTGPHHVTMDAWISCAPFERLLRMDIVEAAAGKAVLTMPFHLDLAQGAGLMHGGALISLADTAVVMAIKSLLPPATHFATIAMASRFLHPVIRGIVTARAEVFERSGRTLQGRAAIVDHEGRVVLEFHSTFKVARDSVIRGATFQDLATGEPN